MSDHKDQQNSTRRVQADAEALSFPTLQTGAVPPESKTAPDGKTVADPSAEAIRPEVAAVLDLIDRAASDLRRGWLAAAYDVLGRAQHHLEKAMAPPERRHE